MSLLTTNLLAALIGAASASVIHRARLGRIARELEAISTSQALLWKLLAEEVEHHNSLAASYRTLSTVALSDLPDTAVVPSVAPWPAD